MSKIPAPVLPEPGAIGASQTSNVVQQSVAPPKAPVPQLFGLGTMSQNQGAAAAQPRTQPPAQSQIDPNMQAQMKRYLFGQQ